MPTSTRSRLSDGPGREIEWHFPSDLRSVGLSRRRLREQAHAWKIPAETTETAVLLLSELMTNACLHAQLPPGAEISARCILGERTLRVEVTDPDDTLPRSREASCDDESGRGLMLVTVLADACGSSPECPGKPGSSGKPGKVMWFLLGL
ncbi:ATP-binding protein [Streptomyces sp. SID3343]|nr:ATP-binding protein [Streptomyces sp. SID3343]MYV99556.1 ATP-binding protein [Streptomyces sp. SID3343]